MESKIRHNGVLFEKEGFQAEIMLFVEYMQKDKKNLFSGDKNKGIMLN